MHFRTNEIAIHLMPAGDKDKAKDKEKGKEKDKGPSPEPEQAIRPGDGGCGQTCTLGTGGIGTAKRETSSDVIRNLAFLQAQLRETLASPPV